MRQELRDFKRTVDVLIEGGAAIPTHHTEATSSANKEWPIFNAVIPTLPAPSSTPQNMVFVTLQLMQESKSPESYN